MRALVLTLLAAFALRAMAAETLYATSLRTQVGGTAVIAGNLYTIDPATGASTLVGAIRIDGTPVGLISIAENPKTHTLYGLTAGRAQSTPASIVILDLQTATATIVAPLSTRGSDMGFDADGTLYMWAPDLDRLTKVDIASGQATPMSAKLVDTAGGGLAIDSREHRALVAVTGAAGSLDIVDLKTGETTRGPKLAGAPYTTAIDNLTFSPSGELFAVNSNGGVPSRASLIVIDPDSGKARNVGALPDDTRGLIFAAPRKVPLSEFPVRAYALIALAFIALAVLAYAFLHKGTVK